MTLTIFFNQILQQKFDLNFNASYFHCLSEYKFLHVAILLWFELLLLFINFMYAAITLKMTT